MVLQGLAFVRPVPSYGPGPGTDWRPGGIEEGHVPEEAGKGRVVEQGGLASFVGVFGASARSSGVHCVQAMWTLAFLTGPMKDRDWKKPGGEHEKAGSRRGVPDAVVGTVGVSASSRDVPSLAPVQARTCLLFCECGQCNPTLLPVLPGPGTDWGPCGIDGGHGREEARRRA